MPRDASSASGTKGACSSGAHPSPRAISGGRGTRALFDDEWLESGDLAYIAGGDVFLTGRTKDLIIRAGRNVYAHEVEEAVGDIPGIRKGCVAVFGSLDRESRTERVVVVAETRRTDQEALQALEERVEAVATAILDGPPDEIVLAPPHTILKTSSGKIRRAASRELYEEGELGRGRRAVAWQLIRLYWTSTVPRLRRGSRAASAALYASYWWSLLVLIAMVTWLLVATLPGERVRWGVVRWAARAMLRLSGTPFRTHGVDRLPRGAGVLVVNHASYIDGLALIAALPRPCLFAAKKELEHRIVAGIFLRRIGTLFVERASVADGVEDTRDVEQALRAGRFVVFFPEGTFFRNPGLLPFKLGAFVAAAQTASPLFPAVLRGTRSILRGAQWFPRRGSITFSVAEPIRPRGSDFAEAVRLRDAARSVVFSQCGEPDLVDEPSSL